MAKDAAKDAFGTSFAPPERGERSERRSQGGAEVAEDEEDKLSWGDEEMRKR